MTNQYDRTKLFSMAKTFKQKAIDYLESRRGEWPLIAQETGIDYQWLSKFAQGKFNDPGVSRVEKLLIHSEEYQQGRAA